MNNGNAKAPTNLVAVTDMDVHTKEISQETHFLHMNFFFLLTAASSTDMHESPWRMCTPKYLSGNPEKYKNSENFRM